MKQAPELASVSFLHRWSAFVNQHFSTN